MKNVTITKDEICSFNSPSIKVKPNQKYKASATFIGKKEQKNSGYFDVFIKDNNKIEILRLRRWLNDFSGTPKIYTIIFTTPQNSENVYVVYRINKNTPIKSDFEISLPDDFTLKLEEVTDNLDEQYD